MMLRYVKFGTWYSYSIAPDYFASVNYCTLYTLHLSSSCECGGEFRPSDPV